MMSTREINSTYAEKIKKFIEKQKSLGKTDIRFSFKISDIKIPENEASVEVIIREAFTDRGFLLFLICNKKVTQPIPKNFENFDMGLDFDKDKNGKFKSNSHRKLYYAVSDNEQVKGEKFRRFWDALIESMENAKIEVYNGNVQKHYPGFIGHEEFGIYITAVIHYKEITDKEMSLKMENHLKKYFGLDNELLKSLRDYKTTFRTGWEPPKLINKQGLPRDLAIRLSKFLYEKKD